MEKFKATHKILDGGKLIKKVFVADADDGRGRILYSKQEWDDHLVADYEQQPDGTITFQGQPTGYHLAEVYQRSTSKKHESRTGSARATHSDTTMHSHESQAHELGLFIDNDGDLYRQMTTPIHKNLIAKMAKGVYQHALGVKAFGHLATEGAKRYAKEQGTPSTWARMFPPEARKIAAQYLAAAFEEEAKLGNYDHLLPKKYQAQRHLGHAHAPKHALPSSRVDREIAQMEVAMGAGEIRHRSR